MADRFFHITKPSVPNGGKGQSPTAIQTPTSPTIDEEKVPNPDFTGKWKLKDYKGIDEYLKSEGWSWVMRKAISKLGNNQYIYHYHKTKKSTKIQNGNYKQNNNDLKDPEQEENENDTETEENISIKSINKGGIYELIPSANLYDKKEITYKDKEGNNVISVFKWNKEKTELIEFLLKEMKDDTQTYSKSIYNKSSRTRQNKIKMKQKSYTKCRYINNSGQMIVNITNQIGKTCTSIYIKDDDISIPQLKNILHLKLDDEDINDNISQKKQEKEKLAKDALYKLFPVNIIEIEQKVNATKDDDEKLNMENIAIQKEIEDINNEIEKLQMRLRIKTEELKINIAINDENINNRNMIKKWKEFEQEWYNWDSTYFMGWLRRIEWNGDKRYDDYDINKNKIDKYCMINFDHSQFLGKFLKKFDRDAIRQIGIQDENDSMCIYQQILELIKRNPMKKDDDDDELKQEEIVDDDFKLFLIEMGLNEYYDIFKKYGFDDLHTIITCCKHKGCDYVEQNVLSNKLKINKINHRMKLMNAFKKIMENEVDDFENDNDNNNNHVIEQENINGIRTEDLL